MKEATFELEPHRLAALERYAILDTLPEDAFDRLADAAAALFDAPIAFVNFVADTFTFSKACFGLDLRRHDRQLSFCARTIEVDDLLIIPDLTRDARFALNPFVTQPGGMRFYAGAPIRTPDGFAIGSVCVLDTTPRDAVPSNVKRVLTHLARLATSELELRRQTLELERTADANTRLLQSLRESQLVSDTLLGVSQLTQLDLEAPELARHAFELIARVVPNDGGVLASRHADTLTISPVSTPVEDEGSLRFMWDVARHALRARRASSSVQAAWFLEPGERASQRFTVPLDGTLACLLVGDVHDVTHVLLLARRNATRWSERDRHVLEAAANALRYAIETREHARHARHAASTDALTGLGNRRAFDADLHAAANGTPFSVAMLDLDGLKRINDTLGHIAGDALLRVFASALASNTSAGARVYRLGGDEFALLFTPDTTATEDVRAAVLEALDAGVAAARTAGFTAAGCSFGVAHWPHDASTPEEVVACADGRLYDDKRARKTRAHSQDSGSEADLVRFGDVTLHLDQRLLFGPRGSVKLAAIDAKILQVLARHAGRLVTRADLAAHASRNDVQGVVSSVRRALANVTSSVHVRATDERGWLLLVRDERSA